jgi:hypothetical protein
MVVGSLVNDSASLPLIKLTNGTSNSTGIFELANRTSSGVVETTASPCAAGKYSDGTCLPDWINIVVPLVCVVIFVLTLLVIFFWSTLCRGRSPAKAMNIEMRPLKTRRSKDDRMEATRQSLINGRDVNTNLNGSLRTA